MLSLLYAGLQGVELGQLNFFNHLLSFYPFLLFFLKPFDEVDIKPVPERETAAHFVLIVFVVVDELVKFLILRVEATKYFILRCHVKFSKDLIEALIFCGFGNAS